MDLTGRPDGPGLGGPPALVDLMERAAGVVARYSDGRAVVDGLALLGERAALGHLTRQGRISCGGGSRLVRAADGWLALSLARPDDIAALAAWAGRPLAPGDPWTVAEQIARRADSATLDARAALLGLPFAAVGSVEPPRTRAFDLPVGAVGRQDAACPPRPVAGARAVDLSTLWAGPLCGQLLAAAGADVVKVESLARPDGARRGPAAFFDLLNGTKRTVALDLTTEGGRCDLQRLLAAADVVIESARPRALEQMGIRADEMLAAPGGPRVWVSITSHGRGPGGRERVGFGDVAAAAGGLVAHGGSRHGHYDGPYFLADAVADPLAGLVAAAAVLEALAAGGRWLLDAAMAPMAASVTGPPADVHGATVRPPRARPVERPAAPLGSDTAAVLGALSP